MNALLYALIAALGNVVGGLVAVRGARLGLRVIEGFVAFSAGFMIAVAIVEVLPEAFGRGGVSAPLYALAGYVLVHLTQHTATQHFHFGEETHHVSPVAGTTALIGLLLHTFFDGVAIASGFAVSTELGLLLFLAILFHKLPEGVTISSLQIAGGKSPRYAVGSAALLGLTTVAGVIATDYVVFLSIHGLPLSAGVTIYVAASNLVPEFQGKRGWRLPAAFFLGVGTLLLADVLLSGVS